MSKRDNDNFQEELITRFFNPQSYFYQCLSSELKAKQANFANPEDSYLIGKVVDELVNAGDKLQKLKELSSINGFEEFYSYLTQEVDRLKLSQLTADEMMASIKTIAQTMADTLIRLVKNADFKRILQKHLGIEIEKSAEPSEKEALFKSKPELVKENISRSRRKKKVRKEEIPASLTKDKREQKRINQPWHGLQTNIGEHLKEIKDHLSQIKKLSINRKVASKLMDSFQDLKDYAMICGMEEVEAIAAKVMEVSKVFRSANYRAWSSEYLSALNEVIKTITHLNSSTQKAKNINMVMHTLRELEILKKRILEKPEQASEAVPPEEISVEDEFVSEKSIAEEGKEISVETEAKTAEPVAVEIDKEFLEEDEELLSQIRELISEEDVTQTIERPPLKSVENIPDFVELRHDFKSEISSGGDEADKEIFIRFKNEADFYFSIIDKAVHTLSEDLGDKKALEDLELACYSLKILAKKLGLEKIGELLGTIETTVTHAIATELDLTPQTLDSIAEAINLIKNLPEKTGTDLGEVIAKIKNLSPPSGSRVKKNSKDAPKTYYGSEDPFDFLMVENSEEFISKLFDENERI